MVIRARARRRRYVHLSSPLQVKQDSCQEQKYSDYYNYCPFSYHFNFLRTPVLQYKCRAKQLIFQYSCIYNFSKRRGAVMIVYMDLENLLKEKNISKNKLCEACNLQRTQLNNYCKNKVSRIDFTIPAKLCEFLDCTPNDILKLKYEVTTKYKVNLCRQESELIFVCFFTFKRKELTI